MAALSNDRDTVQVDHPLNSTKSHTAKASSVFYKGQLCMKRLTEGGVVTPGAASTGSIGAGVSTQNFTAASGDEILLKTGVFFFNNSSSSDEVTEKDVGKLCYIVDDNTVALTSNSGARSIAGRVFDVVSGSVDVPGRGVAVLIHPETIVSGSTI